MSDIFRERRIPRHLIIEDRHASRTRHGQRASRLLMQVSIVVALVVVVASLAGL